MVLDEVGVVRSKGTVNSLEQVEGLVDTARRRTMQAEEPGPADGGGRASRDELARRTSRRSFLGRLGRTVVAIAGGSMVAVALEPDRAEAHHICGHLFTTGSCPHPFSPLEDGRLRVPGASALGYPVDDDGAIYLSERQTRRKVCRPWCRAVPVRAEPAVRRRLEPLLQRTRSAYPGLLFDRRHSDQRRRRGARLLPRARKVFCITYRELNVRC